MDYTELATGGDPDLDSESGWMVYDEMCWFKLLGTSGFNQVHVSLMCVCLHDNSRKKIYLQEMDIGDHILLQVELGLIVGAPHITGIINLGSFPSELVTGISIPRNLIPDALWEVSVIFVRHIESFELIIATTYTRSLCLTTGKPPVI